LYARRHKGLRRSGQKRVTVYFRASPWFEHALLEVTHGYTGVASHNKQPVETPGEHGPKHVTGGIARNRDPAVTETCSESALAVSVLTG
jgi:hypothetical protein